MNNANKLIVCEIARNLSITMELFNQVDFEDKEMNIAETERLTIRRSFVRRAINWSEAK